MRPYKFHIIPNVLPQCWVLCFVAVRLTDVELKLKLHDLAIKDNIPRASHLERIKWQPKQKGHLFIPLCRMMSLSVVRPYLKNDMSQLAIHFMTDGYMEGYGFFMWHWKITMGTPMMWPRVWWRSGQRSERRWMRNSRRNFLQIMTWRFFQLRCSWFGMGTIDCKHGCQSLNSSILMISISISVLRV